MKTTIAAIFTLFTVNTFAVEGGLGTIVDSNGFGFFGKVSILKVEYFQHERQLVYSSNSLSVTEQKDIVNVKIEPELKVFDKGAFGLRVLPSVGFQTTTTSSQERRIDSGSCYYSTKVNYECHNDKTNEDTKFIKSLGVKLNYTTSEKLNVFIQPTVDHVNKVEGKLAVGFSLDF